MDHVPEQPLPWQQAAPPYPSPPVPPAADPWAAATEPLVTDLSFPPPPGPSFPAGPMPGSAAPPARSGRRTLLTVAAAAVAVLVLGAGAALAWRAASGGTKTAGAPTTSTTPVKTRENWATAPRTG
jgi:hypothetical protein